MRIGVDPHCSGTIDLTISENVRKSPAIPRGVGITIRNPENVPTRRMPQLKAVNTKMQNPENASVRRTP